MKSLRRAALHCRVTQPTVSMGVKNLEKDLNTSLLTRTVNSFVLTEEGQRVYAFARNFFEDLEKIKEELRQESKTRHKLKIGINQRYEQTIAPFIEDFILTKPEFAVECIFEDGKKIRDKFRENAYDLIFTINFDDKDNASFHKQGDSIFLFEDETSLCCRQKHPLSELKKTGLVDLAKYPFVIMTHLEKALYGEFHDSNIEVTIAATFNHSDHIVSLIKKTDCLGVLPIYSLPPKARESLVFPDFSMLSANFMFIARFNENPEQGFPEGREVFRSYLQKNKSHFKK
jgi:DNA-binding transcriptional LysR family regulator